MKASKYKFEHPYTSFTLSKDEWMLVLFALVIFWLLMLWHCCICDTFVCRCVGDWCTRVQKPSILAHLGAENKL